MIKFFRRIRKNLISEGKTGKYFKYAIGEIILVVIGILIALQINNWNENRKNQKLFSAYKSELVNDLLLDVSHFDFHLSHAKKENKTIDSLKTILNSPNSNTDTLKNIIKQSLTFFKRERWIMIATTENPFVNDNTFQTLQNSGQITLLDNKLQEELVSFYGYTRKYSFMIKQIIESKNNVYFDYINDIPVKQSKTFNVVNENLYNQIWNNVDWESVQIKFISLLNTYYELNKKTEFFNSIRLEKTNIMINQLKSDL